MDESQFPPAGEPIPGEAEAVARDAVRPQGQLRGERQPPQPLSSQGCGQLTQRDQPSASQELNRGRSADAVAEFSSAHESRWDSTIAKDLFTVVQRGEVDKASRPATSARPAGGCLQLKEEGRNGLFDVSSKLIQL